MAVTLVRCCKMHTSALNGNPVDGLVNVCGLVEDVFDHVPGFVQNLGKHAFFLLFLRLLNGRVTWVPLPLCLSARHLGTGHFLEVVQRRTAVRAAKLVTFITF